jgi:hypothetical protein
MSEFPSSTHFSWSDSYFVRLSGLGEPTGSNVTNSVALRLAGSYKALYHCKVYLLKLISFCFFSFTRKFCFTTFEYHIQNIVSTSLIPFQFMLLATFIFSTKAAQATVQTREIRSNHSQTVEIYQNVLRLVQTEIPCFRWTLMTPKWRRVIHKTVCFTIIKYIR